MPKNVHVCIPTDLRRAGSLADDTKIGRLLPGHVQAYGQCLGDHYAENGDHNRWWVLVWTQDYGFGWVSAAAVGTGRRGGPVPDVPTGPVVWDGSQFF